MDEFVKTILTTEPKSVLQMVFGLLTLLGYAVFNEIRRNKTVKDREEHFTAVDEKVEVIKAKLEMSEERLREKTVQHEDDIEKIRQEHENQISSIIESFSKKTEIVMMKRELFESARHSVIYDAIHSIRKAISGKFQILRFEISQKLRDTMVLSMTKFECPVHAEKECPLRKPITDAQLKGYEAVIISAMFDGEECAEVLIASYPWDADNLNDRNTKDTGSREIYAAIISGMNKDFPSIVTDMPDFEVMPLNYISSNYIELVETVRDIKRNEARKIAEARKIYDSDVKKIWGDRRE